jgi:hypothetical protein
MAFCRVDLELRPSFFQPIPCLKHPTNNSQTKQGKNQNHCRTNTQAHITMQYKPAIPINNALPSNATTRVKNARKRENTQINFSKNGAVLTS